MKPESPLKNRSRSTHAELLIALVGLIFIQSWLSPDNQLHRAFFNGLFFLVVLSAIRALSESTWRMYMTLALGAVAYAISWVNDSVGSFWFSAIGDTCFASVFAVLTFTVGQSVFSRGPVDARRIIGAVSIYFLLGLLWAFFYTLIELIEPGSFRIANADAESQSNSRLLSEFIYFSNVTLTTLGYGDIVPESRPAKTMALLEAMLGQLYIAIVIARMVGMQVAQHQKEPERDKLVESES
ncbi:potassium channel family protein [Rhodopirellula halodulae]|uniref:potassium channel family protein n=1 Tax=Rhodopirellula halodulae TaxID=2894198 RepID=UPI001E4EC5DF|nr:potassium channel family protein [Rhodopirellula sp. JC737]MCC9656769.1 ion channel [Rhodopirellula sp. JC737]